jgi:hypothetical protein
MPSHWPLLRLVRLFSLSSSQRRRVGIGSLKYEKSHYQKPIHPGSSLFNMTAPLFKSTIHHIC